jgi:hypothetical protein
MSTSPILVDLNIQNDPEKIFENTKNILSIILEHISLNIEYQQRIKLILIELITNSIKHSQEKFTAIHLVIDQPRLSIQKIEKGLKIAFSAGSPQIPFENIQKKVKISFSEENRHHIQPLGEYKFEFLKPDPKENPDLDQMPEHFGFYIITLAADTFVYQYDPDLKQSSYIVHLNL